MIPGDTRHCLNVDTMSYDVVCCIDLETTFCLYRDNDNSTHKEVANREKKLKTNKQTKIVVCLSSKRKIKVM